MAELGQNSNHCQSRNLPFKLIIDRGHHTHRLFDRPVLETVSPVARQYLENSLSGTAYCADPAAGILSETRRRYPRIPVRLGDHLRLDEIQPGKEI
jgi:hypothetical protein